MSDDKQKRIFAKNLNYYISLNGKQQNEVAKDIGENASTFNMWCKGNSLPSVSKIQKLADYFKIMKSDLIDEKLDSDPMLDARILSDVETVVILHVNHICEYRVKYKFYRDLCNIKLMQ